MNKASPAEYLRAHFNTFRDYGTGRVNVWDYVIQVGIPLAVSCSLFYFGQYLTRDLVGVLITSLSIFTALLFNLLLLVYDATRKTKGSDDDTRLRSRVLDETHSNISFAIFVAVVDIVAMLVSYLQIERICQIMTIPVYFLMGVFIFTLLMVLKRIHVLVRHDLESG